MTDAPWDAGQHCWLDLMTTDLDAAKAFYSELLGWSFKDLPRPGDTEGVYTMATLGDGEIGGLNELMPDQHAAGVPPSWSIYTAVDDVDATTARVKELGGAALAEPFDIPGTGRMAVLAAPSGEVFSVWKRLSSHVGAGRFDNQSGSFCWGELGTHDVEAATAFYRAIFPWTADRQPMGATDYTTFKVGEAAAAGMYKMPPEMAQVPASWLPYFSVAHIDESLARATDLGATQICPATVAEGVGRFAILRDPQGANLAIVQLDPRD